MKAVYYKEHKSLIIEKGLRGFGNVPMMDNFENHPPVKRFLSSPRLRDNTLTVEVI